MEKQVYHLSQEGKSKFKQQVLKSLLFSLLVVMPILLYYFWGKQAYTIEYLIWVSLFILVIALMSVFFNLRYQMKIANSFSIIIEDEKIIRLQKNTPEIIIYKANIESIHSNQKGLLIKDISKEFIEIPNLIERYEEVYTYLSTLKPIESVSTKFIINNRIILSIVGSICFIAMFLDINIYLRGFCSVTALFGMIYNFILIRKSKHIDKRQKRLSWTMIFLLFPIIGNLLYVFDIGGINSTTQASNYAYSANIKSNQGSYDSALIDIDKAIELMPKNDLFFYNRAEILMDKGDYKQAITDFDYLLERPNIGETYYYHDCLEQRAYAYYRIKKYDSALRDLEELITVDKNNALAYLYRAFVKESLEEYQESLKNYDLALGIDNKNASWYGYKAELLHKLDRIEEACRLWQKQIALGDSTVIDSLKQCNIQVTIGK